MPARHHNFDDVTIAPADADDVYADGALRFTRNGNTESIRLTEADFDRLATVVDLIRSTRTLAAGLAVIDGTPAPSFRAVLAHLDTTSEV